MRRAKPPSKERATTPSISAEIFEIADHPFALGAGDGGEQGHAARRHVNDLAGIFLFVLAHEAAEDAHRHPPVLAAVGHDFGERPVGAAGELALGTHPRGHGGSRLLDICDVRSRHWPSEADGEAFLRLMAVQLRNV